jgi:hypothetical protein
MLKSGKFWFLVLLASAGTVSAQTPIERGKYLVEGILICGNCHSPRAAGGVIFNLMFSAFAAALSKPLWGDE